MITSSCRSASMLRIHLLACMEGTRKADSTSELGTGTPISSSPLHPRARTRTRSWCNWVNAERPAPPLLWMSTSPSLFTPVLHLPPCLQVWHILCHTCDVSHLPASHITPVPCESLHRGPCCPAPPPPLCSSPLASSRPLSVPLLHHKSHAPHTANPSHLPLRVDAQRPALPLPPSPPLHQPRPLPLTHYMSLTQHPSHLSLRVDA